MGLKETYESQMLEMYRKSTGDGEKTDNYGIVCPTYYGKPCKVCDYCKEILFNKDKYDGTPLQQAARDKNIKHHFYSNVLFVTDPNEIVVLDYGTLIHDKLLGYQMDPMSQFKFFFDHENGRNLYIVKTPGATPRKTKYDVEPIIKNSPFPNMRLLAKLEEPEHQLHNIVDMVKAGKVKPLGQSKLPMQRTEVRFLPSWLGPDSFVFSHHVPFHYGLNQDEFNAVQTGQLDPFATIRGGGMEAELHAGGEETKYKQQSFTPPIVTQTVTMEQVAKPKTGWGSFGQKDVVTIARPVTPVASQGEGKPEQMPGRPKCFGTFDANNTECTEECVEDGWGKPCQAVLEGAAQIAKRKQAAKAL